MKKAIHLVVVATAGLLTLGGCSYMPHIPLLGSSTSGDVTLAEPSTYSTAPAGTVTNGVAASPVAHFNLPSPYAEFKNAPAPTQAQLQDDALALQATVQQLNAIEDLEKRTDLCQQYSHNIHRILWDLSKAGTAKDNPDASELQHICPGMQLPN